MSLILIVVLIAAALAAFLATRPNEFRVMRSATINAAPAAVFAKVNDFHNWDAWSPWAKLDPTAKNTFEGATLGTGAVFKWDGNSKVGSGVMTITESRPNDLVRIRLDFLRPFKATNTADFTFKSSGAQTEVSWSMYGKNTLMGKLMSLFMNCDKMVGGQFEQGLANLKALVEKGT